MLLMCLCLLLLGSVLAQVPSPCPGPKEFGARFARFDRDRKQFIRGILFYDESSQRYREYEDAGDLVAKNHTYYDKLILYKENVMYTVDSVTKECVTSKPPPNLPSSIGVPANAKFIDMKTIGVAGVVGEHVTVATYGENFPGGDFFVSVTYPNCFPVSRGFKSKEGNEFETYYDETDGIPSDGIFDVPNKCTPPIV